MKERNTIKQNYRTAHKTRPPPLKKRLSPLGQQQLALDLGGKIQIVELSSREISASVAPLVFRLILTQKSSLEKRAALRRPEQAAAASK